LRKQTLPSSPKRKTSPGLSRFAGLTKARQRAPSRRRWSVASIAGSSPRPMRRPVSRAGMTRVSLTTSASPARSRSGRSRIARSSSSGPPPGHTTRSRAASRGDTGRSAIRSGGRSKSKRSVRTTREPMAGRGQKGKAPRQVRLRTKRRLELGRIRILSVDPGRLLLAALVEAKHLGLLALLAELLGGVNCEQHGLALAVVGSVFLAVELDVPG